MTFDAMRCKQCCSEFLIHREQQLLVPVGGGVREYPHKDCENCDCALYDTMLNRMEAVGHGQLAGALRRLRDKVMQHAARKHA